MNSINKINKKTTVTVLMLEDDRQNRARDTQEAEQCEWQQVSLMLPSRRFYVKIEEDKSSRLAPSFSAKAAQ